MSGISFPSGSISNPSTGGISLPSGSVSNPSGSISTGGSTPPPPVNAQDGYLRTVAEKGDTVPENGYLRTVEEKAA
jgi:hypothetical protein